MEVENILHMNIGDGESSYALNSFLQEIVIRIARPVLKHTIKGMDNLDIICGQCFNVADLGCSSGTNPLLVATNIIDIVHELRGENHSKPPQFQVYLNDLFGNDFNTLFKWVPNFYAKLKKKGEYIGQCFVSATPGSFYDRIFPDKSLHLVHSSYAIHWLSQVPKGLGNNANIYMAKTSPPNVFKAYANQFYTDFTKFLKLRSEEIVCGGRMVLTFVGRSVADPTSDDGCCHWKLLSKSILDMLKEGLVQESDVNSFSMPIYYPCEDEVRNIIDDEGSFSLDTVNVFQVNWDPDDTDYKNMNDSKEQSHKHGKNTAQVLRAVAEPLLAHHFGNSIIDVVFKKFEKHVAEHLEKKKTRYFNILISLTKK